MKISQLKSLIKESIKEVLKENSPMKGTTRAKLINHLKYWATEFSKPYADEDEMNIDYSEYRKQFAQLPEGDPLKKAYYELQDACYDQIGDYYGEGVIAKRIATAKKVAAMNFNAPAMQERRKMPLKENEINTIDYKKLKSIYTLASKLKLYESYIVDETIEDMRRLENAVKTNDESVFEEMEESQIDTYELQGLAKLNPEQQAKWKGIDIALRELSRIISNMDLNLIGEKFKKLAVAINNFNAPTMQERRKMSLKENGSLDPKLAGYWVLKNNTQAISMYPSKQEAEMAFKNRGTKYGSQALNSGWKIVPAEEFVSTTNGVLDKHTTGHPNYVSPYRRPATNDAELAKNKQQDRFDNIARSNREMER